MNAVFQALAWSDAGLLALLLMLVMAAEPSNRRRYAWDVGTKMFLPPLGALGLAILLFTRTHTTVWRAAALAIVASPWLIAIGLKIRDAIDNRLYTDSRGRRWFFRAGPAREIENAIARGDTEAIVRLARVANVNRPGYGGMRFLTLVLGKHHEAPRRMEALQALVDAGADPNLGSHGQLPIEMACRVGPEAVALLMQAGADPHRKCDSGAPALFWGRPQSRGAKSGNAQGPTHV